MESFLEFFSFSDANVRYVVSGIILLAASTAAIGCFAFIRKQSLIGDAVSHAVLPGICLAFILFDTKNPLVLLAGAAVTGWLSTLSIDYIVDKSRIKSDTAIGLVLSVFFGFGILLLTMIQHSGNASQSGLDHYLFGRAASLIGTDVWILGSVAVILLTLLFVFFKPFRLISFDENYAESIGVPVKLYEVILSALMVFAIAVGIQAVGVVLMAAMLIAPAAAARYWTNELNYMILFAVLFSVISGIFGTYISYTAPKMPTGPWIIVCMSIIAFLSILFAPKRGVFTKYIKSRNRQDKVLLENILKCFYHLAEADGNYEAYRSVNEIQARRQFNASALTAGLKKLVRKDLLEKDFDGWMLTEEGKKEGIRLARIHRLWELYLSKFLKMPEDHVHAGADVIEHFITPEMEAMLLEELGNPTVDPHNREIPY